MTLTLTGGADGWSKRPPDVVTNAACALLLLTRTHPSTREVLKGDGRITQLLAALSNHGCDSQKKVSGGQGVC